VPLWGEGRKRETVPSLPQPHPHTDAVAALEWWTVDQRESTSEVERWRERGRKIVRAQESRCEVASQRGRERERERER
jgi:hypothetical protein